MHRKLSLLPEANVTSLHGSKPIHWSLLHIKKKACFCPIPLLCAGYNRLCSCNQPLSFQHSQFFPYWIFPTDVRHAFTSPIFSKRSFEHTQQAAPILCSTLQLYSISLSQHLYLGTSLVVQWSRIHLPMQGTSIWSLVWDDATCFEAAKPTCHNDRTQVLQLAKATYPRAWARQPEKPPQWEAPYHNEDPAQPK